jgi:dTDP-4-dehydrorhamnose reductase
MRKRYPKTIICHMPLIFGNALPIATSLLQPILNAIIKRLKLKLFTDEYRTPISATTAVAGLFLAL